MSNPPRIPKRGAQAKFHAKAKIIGVIALQGGFAEHMEMLEKCGAKAVAVRTVAEAEQCDAIILPGGESTTIMPMLKKSGLGPWLQKRAAQGMPIFGTCAGLIALGKGRLNLLDVSVERNAYGGQLASFEADLIIPTFGEKALKGVFIRAPRVQKTGKEVRTLASHEGAPVLVEAKNLLGATFHPELTNDMRLHQYFLEKCSGNC